MTQTGIGGGVALTALQLCVAAGINTSVTSGDQAKIDKAVGMGAKGGANYKSGPYLHTDLLSPENDVHVSVRF